MIIIIVVIIVMIMIIIIMLSPIPSTPHHLKSRALVRSCRAQRETESAQQRMDLMAQDEQERSKVG